VARWHAVGSDWVARSQVWQRMHSAQQRLKGAGEVAGMPLVAADTIYVCVTICNNRHDYQIEPKLKAPAQKMHVTLNEIFPVQCFILEVEMCHIPINNHVRRRTRLLHDSTKR
jgi:hypothetical protein